ncbi:hypothetical protein KP509_37G044700 [Ceratopteris richardii]|uniref:C2 NT-type domain-containing protein n=1 Tax=Ceratopteris richardii TaxID=49495 RepID=A0A8T2Q8I1_CERRI|nr:hypothetical protein KP509_37G044700 [Ceratopteris richardii]KAH7279945.1 hypothetical protein KP509_37G044700 [Ceratopteris richardii]
MIPSKPATESNRSDVADMPPKAAISSPPVSNSSDSLKRNLDPFQQEKKPLWDWRPLGGAASSAAGLPANWKRFHVIYSLHVHSIQNLPKALDGFRLVVHWSRQEEGLQTMPARVLDGVAEFDEILRQRCTVFGYLRSNNRVRYDPKLFTLSVVALDADDMELGKHHIDLSKLLYEEDVADVAEKPNQMWRTSFELSSMAKGSSIFVTFSCDLLHQETPDEKDNRGENISSGLRSVLLHENKDFSKKDAFQSPSQNDQSSDTSMAEFMSSSELHYNESEQDEARLVEELSSDLEDEIDLVAGEFLNMLDFGIDPGSDEEADSPRARLLRQFEHEGIFGDDLGFSTYPTGNSKYNGNYVDKGFGVSTEIPQEYEFDDDLELASIVEAAESELEKAVQNARSKTRAQELEDEETQALMQKWGLNENAIRNSPPKPVFGPHLRPPPPLAKGLGSVLHLEDGGSLRSMSPSLLPNKRAGGSLVMQASKPVVVPSGMGSNAVDVLRHLASLGSETLAKQAMAAMPLQDVTRIADNLVAKQSSTSERHSNIGSSEFSSKSERFGGRGIAGGYDDYVSLEDLAPLAMQNIEALAMDGLKIQADVSEEDAPSYLDAAAWGMVSDMKRGGDNNIQLSHDVAGMRFGNLCLQGDSSSEANESSPFSMALTLEEWSKFDAGIMEDDEKSKERSLAIMAAHNADMQLAKGRSRKGGNMGNTLMIAVLVQLRDPLQNFESIGAPMLALVQAERVMVPPKPRMGRNVSVTGNSDVDDESDETTLKTEEVPQFKLTGVHMSGMKTSEDSAPAVKGLEAPKKGWGNQKQLQSGSRWLAAQGMIKGSKPSLLKGKVAPAPPQTKGKSGDSLWSISSRMSGPGSKRASAPSKPHMRNPDVILSK